jgi:hypothetical protein
MPVDTPSTPHDPRLAALRAWIDQCHPGRIRSIAPASADASFRRYFRIGFDDGSTLIAMDAPPEREDCRPFVQVAGLLGEAGLNAPQVRAADLEQGFLLLTDLGHQTFLAAMREDEAAAPTDDSARTTASANARVDALYSAAIDALVQWQRASRPGVLPPYDAALLRRELDLFPQWYLGEHLGIAEEPGVRAMLEPVFATLIASALAQPRVWVHRDYMPRNLMISTPNPGILDFQDAVEGPITYDVVSLFRDAFISWPEAQVIDWTIRYWEQARKAGLPVDADFGEFYRVFEWMGLQRHLKVLGIFARLQHRDGKPDYLRDAPRFHQYVRGVAGRYGVFGGLAALIDRIEAREHRTGLSF